MLNSDNPRVGGSMDADRLRPIATVGAHMRVLRKYRKSGTLATTFERYVDDWVNHDVRQTWV